MSNIILTFSINPEDIIKCKEFTNKVVNQTYNRFNKELKERKKRIFFGKIGETIFFNYLISLNKKIDNKDMFKIFIGETNVDNFDFKTIDNQTIDIKTAYENFHHRIIIPEDQFENNKAKDFYVGIKIFYKNKIAKIYGFTTKENLLLNKKQNFGEGYAYWEYLNSLSNIEFLIKKI